MSIFFDKIKSGCIEEAVQLFTKNELNASLLSTWISEKGEDGWTTLHWSTKMGSERLVELIISFDPSVLDSQTKEGFTSLHIATELVLIILSLIRQPISLR